MNSEKIQLHIAEKLFESDNNIKFKPVGGGCINNGGKIYNGQKEYFVKWNDADTYPGMFQTEVKGLHTLAEPGVIHIPGVVLQGEIEDTSYLVLDWIETGPRKRDYWTILGQQLAELHRNTNEEFGLGYSNYIGSLPQVNAPNESWTDFFIECRMIPMIERARNEGLLNREWTSKLESIFPKLDSYFPDENPALIHGDLWSGNLMTNAEGDPCLIDPAVYFGHREMELSFTSLFGGFDREFYSEYNECFPLENGFEERVDIYNLYPLLVHLNLFGTSYLSNIQLSIKPYL